MTPLRAGLVGGGRIAAVHARALDAAAGVRLSAVCDLDTDRAEALARPRRAAVYESWSEMLDAERLDLVWVATPPSEHRGPAVAALECGRHVYLEKPIAHTLEDAVAISTAAGSASGVCAVGYQWHASELLDAVRAALADRPLGMLVGRNLGPAASRPWFVARAPGGGQILERASHHIDLQRALAGEIAAVRAFAADAALADRAESAIDDAIVLVLQFRSGALGTIHSAWSADGQPGCYSLDLLGRDATIWLELGPAAHRMRGAAGGRALDAAFGDPMERSVARFLDAARAGDASRAACPPDDATRTLSVALACERALADGEEVAV